MIPVVVGDVVVEGGHDRLALFQVEGPSRSLFLEEDPARFEGAFGAPVELLLELPVATGVTATQFVPLRPQRPHGLGLRMDLQGGLRQFLDLLAKRLALRANRVRAPVPKLANPSADVLQVGTERLRLCPRQALDQVPERAVPLHGLVDGAPFDAVAQGGERVGYLVGDAAH